ncbi:MAG: hypothetical protein GKR87_00845 [Kiritimatiellae bacterium]|nr:hypothetical protein [Kiritimatiellia bacterium]
MDKAVSRIYDAIQFDFELIALRIRGHLGWFHSLIFEKSWTLFLQFLTPKSLSSALKIKASMTFSASTNYPRKILEYNTAQEFFNLEVAA